LAAENSIIVCCSRFQSRGEATVFEIRREGMEKFNNLLLMKDSDFGVVGTNNYLKYF
jgi:hypothetical protein